MRVRAQSASGDYTFGQGAANFLVNSPAAVGQRVQTRLLLWRGEWYLDVNEGTPWDTEVLGTNTRALYDLAVQERILSTPGVTAILAYSSTLEGRRLSVQAKVDTLYSTGDGGTSTNVAVVI